MTAGGRRVVRRASGRLWHHLGRRGVALLFFGLLDLVYAFSLFNPLPVERRGSGQAFVASVAPLPFWGAMWLAVGLVCLVQAWARRDQIGFAAAIMIKCVWGTVFLIGGLTGQIERAYVSVVIWLALAGFVAVISTWPEPPSTRLIIRPDSPGPPRGIRDTRPL